MASNYQDLIVRKKAIELTKEIYNITTRFPNHEIYGLTSQMRRAAVSVPSNIAEGNERNTDKEYINFLYIAKGSAAELETQVIIAQGLGFIAEEVKKKLLDNIVEILKMLNALIRKISSR